MAVPAVVVLLEMLLGCVTLHGLQSIPRASSNIYQCLAGDQEMVIKLVFA
jgi:hypothetical protein